MPVESSATMTVSQRLNDNVRLPWEEKTKPKPESNQRSDQTGDQNSIDVENRSRMGVAKKCDQRE